VPFYAWLVVFCLIIFQISYVNIRNYEIDDCIEYAKGINSLVIDAIDLDRVDEYLRIGRAAPGYNESEAQLNKLRNAYPDVVFLYVYQIKPDERFNALRYVNLFYHYNNVKKGESSDGEFLGL
jgi:hypothetical protein